MPTPRPRLLDIFLTFLAVGLQSFGGGSSTFILINRACLKRGWLTDEAFVRLWALAQLSPGTNLIKLTVMVGYQLAGWTGLLAAMTGLLLPSGLATILMTAGFAAIRNQPLVQAALKGILPAVVGLTLAMGFQMAQPVFQHARREGRLRVGVNILILLASALLLGFTSLSPVVVLLLAGAASVLVFALFPVPAGEIEQTGL